MRILITSIVISLTAVGCTKGPNTVEPCARAVENARGLVEEDEDARMRYGSEPITLARCRALGASREELACLGYASSMRELEACSPGALTPGVAGR